ncbi:MAG: methyltransferase, FkbM family domain protein, partial [Gammaproteobacteria bacterium]|nr:methyltransferase, FkbM family domain protein [Gammaproteobacteria bacterium]
MRIGYVSGDFYSHAVAFFIKSILENHDRSQFEVFCYSHQKVSDQVTFNLKVLADHWREITHVSDFEAARMIYRDNIDILIDLSGHTRDGRMEVSAFKPAPIQVSYLGYPGSTGLDEMDYWITDHLIHPEDTTEPSTESKYRLNRCWTVYQPLQELPEITEKPAGTPLTFGVINHIGKHSAQFIGIWSRILEQNPDSQLIVKSVEFRSTDL